MKSNVIHLNYYKLEKHVDCFIETGRLSEFLYTDKGLKPELKSICDGDVYCELEKSLAVKLANTYLIEIAQFDTDYKSLLSNLNSKDTRYKFPTILSKYKKTVNPLYSIQQELQASILQTDQTHISRWIVNTFLDEMFLCDACKDLENDLLTISLFAKKYKSNHKYINKKLKELEKISSKLSYCLSDFELILENKEELRDLG